MACVLHGGGSPTHLKEISMKKFTIPLAIVAAASLAACVSAPETRVISATDSVYRASAGPVITSVGQVRSGLARVGFPMSSTTPYNGSATQVITFTMRDGTKQTVVTQGSQLRMAETVEILPD